MNNTFNIAAFILLVIIILTLTNCKSDKINSPQEGGVIEGKVTNSFTDQGLANTLIELEGGYSQFPDTITDENGSYNFHSVSQGIYTIITTKYGYEAGKDTFTVYPGNTTTANIALDPGELIGAWSATDIYIPQLNQNYLLSELGLEIEIAFDENGEYRGITTDSLSSSVNEGNWYTSDGNLIILDPEVGEHKGQYIWEENALKLKNWVVDYQGVVISVDINFVKHFDVPLQFINDGSQGGIVKGIKIYLFRDSIRLHKEGSIVLEETSIENMGKKLKAFSSFYISGKESLHRIYGTEIYDSLKIGIYNCIVTCITLEGANLKTNFTFTLNESNINGLNSGWSQLVPSDEMYKLNEK